MCFGGRTLEELKDGFVIDMRDKSVKQMLGAEKDLRFSC